MKFSHSILGGTFDNLHIGHEFFIKSAYQDSEHVTIGLTQQEFILEKPFSNLIEGYEERKQKLTKFLEHNNLLIRTSIIPINDIYGSALTEKSIDAIFVTEHGYENALQINQKRKEINFPELEIVMAKWVYGEDGSIISSTSIRSGKSDTKGKSFLIPYTSNTNYHLPFFLRKTLQQPFGKVVSNPSDFNESLKNSFVISVGDIVTTDLLKNNIVPNIGVFDLKTHREKIENSAILSTLPKEHVKLINAHGTINSQTAQELYHFLQESMRTKKNFLVHIDGEEDLLAIPLILLAPLNSKLVYGIQDVGAVIVTVTLDKKEEVRNIFEKFETN